MSNIQGANNNNNFMSAHSVRENNNASTVYSWASSGKNVERDNVVNSDKVKLRLPVPSNVQKTIEDRFMMVKVKIKIAISNISSLLIRTTPANSVYRGSIQRLLDQARSIYDDIDAQHALWNQAMRKGTQGVVVLPNRPLSPLGDERRVRGLRYNKDKTLVRANTNTQVAFNQIGQHFSYLDSTLPKATPNGKMRVSPVRGIVGKLKRFAMTRKNASSPSSPSPLNKTDLQAIEKRFNEAKLKIHKAIMNLRILLQRATPRYTLKIQRYVDQAQHVYHEIDVQHMKWSYILRHSGKERRLTPLDYPPGPLSPLPRDGFQSNKHDIIAQLMPNTQRLLDNINKEYMHLHTRLPRLGNAPTVQNGSPQRFAYLRKVFSSGLLPKSRR